jgi:CheY-like chemotaxis protein
MIGCATKVLVVEDDPVVSRILSRQLASEGCEVHSAGCAEEAIRLAGSDRFDLILTDVNLPGMNGLAAIGALKRAGGAPVLVMTGYLAEGFAEDARLLGAIGLITKPFESEVFRDFLGSCRRSKPSNSSRAGIDPTG